MEEEDFNRSLAEMAMWEKRVPEVRKLANELGVTPAGWPMFRDVILSHEARRQAWIVRRLQKYQPHWFKK